MALTTVDSHPNSCFPEANRNKPNILSNSVTFERLTTSQQDLVGSLYLGRVSGDALPSSDDSHAVHNESLFMNNGRVVV